MNIAQALDHSCQLLIDSDSAMLDSQMLLCYVLGCATAYLHSYPKQALSGQQQDHFVQLISQRQQGKPIAYLIGQRGFWSLDLKVTEDTLIPRPDTELLVELALTQLTPNMIVADLGTGSGAIALALAKEQPAIQLVVMDYSAPALAVAQYNALNNQLTNVLFWQGKWLDAVAADSLDMIICNPPYIKMDDPHLAQGDVRFEPLTALVSGSDGLADLRIIVQQAQQCLRPKGYLLVEHGYDQAAQVMQIFDDAGFINIESQQDWGNNDRVVMGQCSE